MQKNKMIAPSTERAKNINEILQLEKDILQSADFLHVDIMDGTFVERTLLSKQELEELTKHSKMPLDFHLMCDFVDDEEKLDFYISLKPKIISVHLEAFKNKKALMVALQKIKQADIKVGLAIKLETDIEKAFEFLTFVDLVLIMSVKVGWGGQTFDKLAFTKLEKTKVEIERKNLQTLVQIDGGVNIKNAQELFLKGADILVCGSVVFNSENRAKTIKLLKS